VSNQNAPFGFLPVGTSSGMPNFSVSVMRIAAADTTPIYKGDVCSFVTNTPTGYIKQATAAEFSTNTYNNKVAGIFWGCEYLSTSQKRTVWSPYWPGSDTSYDVKAYVINDPNARFRVMGNSTAFNIGGSSDSVWTTSPIGLLATFVVGTGSAATGLSGAYLAAQTDTSGAKAPFQVIDLVTAPPGANGTDITSAYNHVIVGFVAEWLRNNSAVTGIS
jgi:hypothetical protein